MSARAPLMAYVPYQARDALPKALVPVGLFALLGGLPLWTIARQQSLEALQQPGRIQDAALQIYAQAMGMAMTLGAIVLMSGLASLDRDRGHVRFLFAQPVAPWRYYLQRFVVGAGLFVACFALVPLGFSAVVTEVPVVPALQGAALYALVYGALGTLCSAAWNKDGVAFILVIVLARTLQQLATTGALPGWLEGVAHALPPLHAADTVRDAWLAGRALAGNDLVLVLGYAAGMLVSALLLIRHRPLAR